jgi:hypothetical protein
MTTTKIRTESAGRFLGDSYERLRSAAETLASDPAMVETESVFAAEGMRAFAESLISARLLDGLSEHDANTVAMLALLDFTRGPERMAWRLTDWLNPDGNTTGRQDDDTAAVVAVLAMSPGLVMGAFAGAEFTEASSMAKMFASEGTKAVQ